MEQQLNEQRKKELEAAYRVLSEFTANDAPLTKIQGRLCDAFQKTLKPNQEEIKTGQYKNQYVLVETHPAKAG